ncbi:MAG: DUF72 domain-containing protein [Gemmatimonadaceae bacterium]
MSGSVRIGTQGWNYDAWVGPFYPPHTRPAEFLSVYARAFDTVEVDSTFYAVPSAKTVRGWADRTPSQFRFALKMPQEVTHERRLRECAGVAAEFFDRARELEGKLAAVLLQFGSDFTPAELPALAEFIPKLPGDIRFAVEFRDKGWIYDGVLALLAEHGVALALTEGKWISRRQTFALAERPTADLIYVRWMGNREIVDFSRVQVDRTRELEAWAEVLARLERDGRTILGYFNNHFSGHSPASARDLQRLLRQSPVDPEHLGEQMSLF